MSIMQARLAADGADRRGGRGGAVSGGGDLLGLLLEAWTPQPQHGNGGETLTTDEVIDECKTFFAAGQETTATLLVWAMFLLAVHPEWQDKVREEVVREFCTSDDGEVPHADVLAKLKLVRSLHASLLSESNKHSLTHASIMHAAIHGVAGDVAALPADRVHTAEGCLGRRPWRHQGAPGHRHLHPHCHAAPGQAGLGPRRR
jgi:cytochrome P450